MTVAWGFEGVRENAVEHKCTATGRSEGTRPNGPDIQVNASADKGDKVNQKARYKLLSSSKHRAMQVRA